MANGVGAVARSGAVLPAGLSGLLAALLDLLGSAPCAGCGCPAMDDVCDGCRRRLRDQPPVARWLETAAGLVVPAVAAASYNDSVRKLLIAYKERGRRGLRRELGDALFVAVLGLLAAPALQPHAAGCGRRLMPAAWPWAGPGPPVVLVPVPSQLAARRARGHDPVPAVARQAAAQLRALGRRAAVADLLAHARSVADQAGLDVPGRYANLAGAMAVRHPAALRGATVVVVDDIVTTGATAAEAVRAIAAAGGCVLGVAAVAMTPRRVAWRGGTLAEVRSGAAKRRRAG